MLVPGDGTQILAVWPWELSEFTRVNAGSQACWLGPDSNTEVNVALIERRS